MTLTALTLLAVDAAPPPQWNYIGEGVSASVIAALIGLMIYLVKTALPEKDKQHTLAVTELGKSHKEAVETLATTFTAALDKALAESRAGCKEEIGRLLEVLEVRPKPRSGGVPHE